MTNEEKLEVYEGLIRELTTNHLELVYKDNCGYYFRIKGSKGKDKSWTSLHNFFKDYFPITIEPCKKGRCKFIPTDSIKIN